MQTDGKAARAAGLFPVIMKKSFISEGEPAAVKKAPPMRKQKYHSHQYRQNAGPLDNRRIHLLSNPEPQPQRRTAAWPGGEEREEGMMAFATMNASPPRTCRCQESPTPEGNPPLAKKAPPRKGK